MTNLRSLTPETIFIAVKEQTIQVHTAAAIRNMPNGARISPNSAAAAASRDTGSVATPSEATTAPKEAPLFDMLDMIMPMPHMAKKAIALRISRRRKKLP